MKPNEIIKTFDGSHSLISAHFGEMYHSKHGALQESLHVFLKNGFEVKAKSLATINILEMGFGTGLNAWLTLIGNKNNSKVNYYAVESHPVLIETALQLNYVNEDEKEQFLKLHKADWNKWESLNSNFNLFKFKGELQQTQTDMKFDLVYYDAFAPSAQPELWTEDIFKKLFNLMYDKAILTTYCAKGIVKRALKASGFTIESVPGPPGKREMTIAHKS